MGQFRTAVARDFPEKSPWKPGIQALVKRDRERIVCDTDSRLSGSINLEAALLSQRSNEPLWDYAVGCSRRAPSDDFIFWIEVHPATPGEVKAIFAKLQSLQKWLRDSAENLSQLPREFIWIASGNVSILKQSRERKQLAQRGVKLRGQRFTIRDPR